MASRAIKSSTTGRNNKQLNFLCEIVLKAILDHEYSWSFKNMSSADYNYRLDLLTIKTRLKNDFYSTTEQVIQDLNTMFDNCYDNHSPETDVVKMAKVLHNECLKLVMFMPSNEIENCIDELGSNTASSDEEIDVIKTDLAKSQNSMNGGINSVANADMIFDSYKASTSNTSATKIREKKPMCVKPHYFLPIYQKYTRRFKSLSNKEISLRNLKKMLPTNLKVCVDILKALSSEEASFPFYEPLRVFGKIKNPMGLKIVKKKLEKLFYKNVSEFSADIRLIFENCYKYFDADDFMFKMCKRFENSFEMLMNNNPNARVTDDNKTEDSSSDNSDLSNEMEEFIEKRNKFTKMFKHVITLEEAREHYRSLQPDDTAGNDKAYKPPGFMDDIDKLILEYEANFLHDGNNEDEDEEEEEQDDEYDEEEEYEYDNEEDYYDIEEIEEIEEDYSDDIEDDDDDEVEEDDVKDEGTEKDVATKNDS